MAQAYKRLSPEFKRRLHGLRAVHSGREQVNNSLNRGGIARRDPVDSVHPVVRTHPVSFVGLERLEKAQADCFLDRSQRRKPSM